MFSLAVYFIADAIFLSPHCSASNKHTLSLSLSHCLAVFPSASFWYKNPGNHFQIIIDHNKVFWFASLFHLEAAHNKIISLPNASRNCDEGHCGLGLICYTRVEVNDHVKHSSLLLFTNIKSFILQFHIPFWGRIFSRVQPFCERADLNKYIYMNIPCIVCTKLVHRRVAHD